MEITFNSVTRIIKNEKNRCYSRSDHGGNFFRGVDLGNSLDGGLDVGLVVSIDDLVGVELLVSLDFRIIVSRRT